MRPALRIPRNLRFSGGLPVRCLTTSTSLAPRKNVAYRRVQDQFCDNKSSRYSLSQLSNNPSLIHSHTLNQIYINAFSTSSRYKAISFRDLKSDDKGKPSSKPNPEKTAKEAPGTSSSKEEEPAEKAYREAQKEAEASRGKTRQKKEDENSRDNKDEGTAGNRGEQKKRAEPPPPPPHGNKSPWQVFTETLRSEFQASKEWNDSTKQLASSAHQFTENESVKRARAAYTAASGAATSGTASAIKNTGKVIGQGAAWTWDTTVVKGVRTGVNATASGIDKVTKPVRDTRVYKTAVGGVKDVIDDGSSSKYGGWIEKEERRKQRELRELNEAGPVGRTGKRVEKMEEDPK